MRKKPLLILLTIITLSASMIMMSSLLALHASAAYTEWDAAATTFAGGDGTAANPYQVSTTAEFALMASKVNAAANASDCFILMNDIYFNDTTNLANWGTTAPKHNYADYCTGAKRYSGTIDGNGKTIYGLYDGGTKAGYYGLVRVLGDTVSDGTIKNLTIADSYFNATTKSGASATGAVGAFAGITPAGKVSITGCKTTATVTVYASVDGAGGFIGVVGADIGSLTVDKCINRATVIAAASTAGGIIGRVRPESTEASPKIISGCVNYGAISANTIAGGICGAMAGEVKGCVNYGKISAATEISGGIVGSPANGTKYDGSVDGCVNYGEVCGTDKVGGITGNLASGGDGEQKVTNCVNLGKLTSTGANVGAIAGFFGTEGTATAIITNCYGSQILAAPLDVKPASGDNIDAANLIITAASTKTGVTLSTIAKPATPGTTGTTDTTGTPGNPDNPLTPDNPGTPDNPSTGDANLTVLVVVMLVSALGVAFVYARRRMLSK